MVKLKQCTWIIIVMLPVLITGQNYENVTRLRAKLLEGYHSDVRPLDNHSDIMNINISVTLFSLQELDQVKGVLTITVATSVTWYDQRMTWDPADYDGIAKMLILMNEVWTPSITLAHPVEFTTMGNTNTHVEFFSNGLAVFSPGGVLQSPCRFNTKFWPFDKQVCDIGFFPLDFTKEEVRLHIIPPGINTDFYIQNSVWTLDETSYYEKVSYHFSAVYFRLKLSRQPLFYIITTVLPILGISSLSCLVFLLPSESGERVSFVVTILLAMAVFLTVIKDDLPKSSEPVSLMCIFILLDVLFNSFNSFFVIMGLSIFHRDEKVPKSRWHISIVRISNCKRKKHVSNKSELKDNEGNKTELFNESFEDREITWPDVSKALDKVMLFVSAVFLYMPTLFLLAYLKTASDYPEH